MILCCVPIDFQYFWSIFVFIFIPIQIINKKHLIKNELNITSRDCQIQKGKAGGALQEGARKNA